MFRPYILAIFRKLQVWLTCTPHTATCHMYAWFKHDDLITFQDIRILSTVPHMDRLIREVAEMELHANNANRENCLTLSGSWKPLFRLLRGSKRRPSSGDYLTAFLRATVFFTVCFILHFHFCSYFRFLFLLFHLLFTNSSFLPLSLCPYFQIYFCLSPRPVPVRGISSPANSPRCSTGLPHVVNWLVLEKNFNVVVMI